MKLFTVSYIDDYDCESFLIVGTNKKDVYQRVWNDLSKSCNCLLNVAVTEVEKVDGWRIELKPTKDIRSCTCVKES